MSPQILPHHGAGFRLDFWLQPMLPAKWSSLSPFTGRSQGRGEREERGKVRGPCKSCDGNSRMLRVSAAGDGCALTDYLWRRVSCSVLRVGPLTPEMKQWGSAHRLALLSAPRPPPLCRSPGFLPNRVAEGQSSTLTPPRPHPMPARPPPAPPPPHPVCDCVQVAGISEPRLLGLCGCASHRMVAARLQAQVPGGLPGALTSSPFCPNCSALPVVFYAFRNPHTICLILKN